MERRKHVGVIGLGRFGVALVRALADRGADVDAFDARAEEPHGLEPRAADAAAGKGAIAIHEVDGRDGERLAELGVRDFDEVVVAIGEGFEVQEECILALEELGVEHIVARGQTTERREILRKLGAGTVVSPEIESAERIADRLTRGRLGEAVEIGPGVEAITVEAPRAFDGKTLAELDPIQGFGVLVVQVTHVDESGTVIGVSAPAVSETKLRLGDRLLMVGGRDAILRFTEG